MSERAEGTNERVETATLARGLGRVVIVSHPTFNGRPQPWRVVIDTIERRVTTDLATGAVLEVVSFRGATTTEDGWSGRKTFFAPRCTKLLDVATGEEVTDDLAAWLVRAAGAAKEGRLSTVSASEAGATAGRAVDAVEGNLRVGRPPGGRDPDPTKR